VSAALLALCDRIVAGLLGLARWTAAGVVAAVGVHYAGGGDAAFVAACFGAGPAWSLASLGWRFVRTRGPVLP
jgi:hypothetical protein